MAISYLANRWAVSETSVAVQYIGLGVFIIAEAVIFIPLLVIAAYYSGDPGVILKAGVVSLGLFAGLTFTVLVTRTDFSWLAPILAIGGFAALGFIIASALFGFNPAGALVSGAQQSPPALNAPAPATQAVPAPAAN